MTHRLLLGATDQVVGLRFFVGLRFALDVRESGLDSAVKREAIRVSERYVVPSISSGLWDVAVSKMDPKFSNSPFGRLAEAAFKKTMNQVMSKGAEALAKETEYHDHEQG